uniref:EOG090X0KMN n=1 Tax=Lynceus sp. MCZ IZ 141354 TaxID=1930659 RepID=A0A9N6WUM9_9CRUS|nr:EOG090X0KMN [Lynceus sp. MCZ IZ 141354]
MENYKKGKNVEPELTLSDTNLPGIVENTPWMKVKPGSKMTNIITAATKLFEEKGVVIWSGVGPSMYKAISCVEIMKRKHKDIHQISRTNFVKNEEYWEPLLEGLDSLKVVRNVPAIHMLLSKSPLDETDPGYQGPNCTEYFWKSNSSPKKQHPVKKAPRNRKKPNLKTKTPVLVDTNVNEKTKRTNQKNCSHYKLVEGFEREK